jgi:hypothetical protein
MPLLEFWSSNPAAIGQLTIEQIVATAGSGNLQDNSDCSNELREYLGQIDSQRLSIYIERCLTSHFPKSGLVLQDLVNELGRRLDYNVSNGRYQGTTNAIGYDGIWVSPDGHGIIVEVKTTDTYRISLDTIARYREELIKAGQIAANSSVLIVVGRDDTGELEAQIRGSRHAWDMRLIGTAALAKLVQLKEGAEGPEIGHKIRSLLTPREYTRLDEMVDVMFTTAKDVENAVGAETGKEDEPPQPDASAEKEKSEWNFTDSALLQGKREEIVIALSKREDTPLIRKSRALYWNPNHDVRAAFTVSKRYAKKGGPAYWYAYHPQWRDFLGEVDRGYLVLGCMDRNEAFAVPVGQFHPLLAALNTTEKEDGSFYWHLHLFEDQFGKVSLTLSKQRKSLPLLPFVLPL